MGSKSFHTLFVQGGTSTPQSQAVVEEAILQIKINDIPYTTTVRTPGNDDALCRGLLFTEGVYTHTDALQPHSIPDPESGVIACLELTIPTEHLNKPLEDRRSSMTSASCGLCGTREPEEVQIYGGPLQFSPQSQLDATKIPHMMTAMAEHQTIFQSTGGCHAAAAFCRDGTLLEVFEDVGRHNAVDKVIGALLNQGPLDRATCLCISGRISYEIVYKAYQALIPYIVAVSAPSSLAIETAERFGLCLIAFCRDKRFTVYAHQDHLQGLDNEA